MSASLLHFQSGQTVVVPLSLSEVSSEMANEGVSHFPNPPGGVPVVVNFAYVTHAVEAMGFDQD